MSLALTVRCDTSFGQVGTCGAYLPTGTADEAEAYAAARRAGWGVAPDRCPGHVYRPRSTTPVRHLRTRAPEEPTR
ncbi:hypothetical protein ABZX72_29415 [Streptomyces cyaneofuscatus]|uniref:hypothetical protein n=1 Tax=Streptomyces cyaneofuscatus TaxID=66883 RepID=UPI0033B9A475